MKPYVENGADPAALRDWVERSSRSVGSQLFYISSIRLNEQGNPIASQNIPDLNLAPNILFCRLKRIKENLGVEHRPALDIDAVVSVSLYCNQLGMDDRGVSSTALAGLWPISD